MVDVYILDLWKSVRFGFFFYLGVILSLFLVNLWVGKLNFFIVLAVVWFGTLVRFVLFKDFKAFYKSLLFSAFFVGLFFVLGTFFGSVSVLVLFLGFVLWRIIRGRFVFMNSMRKIETILFGKSLDKENFKTGKKPSIYKEEEKDGIYKK